MYRENDNLNTKEIEKYMKLSQEELDMLIEEDRKRVLEEREHLKNKKNN